MLNAIHHESCLDGLSRLTAASVDLMFADLPYGRTQNSWDRLVPMEDLWPALRRVCRPNTPMVFTAIQPFTSLLVCSNLKDFRYEMVWQKNKSTGFLNAKRQPLRAHESVLVFYEKQPAYSPQMSSGHPPVNTYGTQAGGSNYGRTKVMKGGGSTQRYPTSILRIPVLNNDDPEHIHSTQKPEELVAWFIRTYTKPGDLVLDPTAGSGTTLAAAKRLGRQYVGFDTDAEMVEKATKRLENT